MSRIQNTAAFTLMNKGPSASYWKPYTEIYSENLPLYVCFNHRC